MRRRRSASTCHSRERVRLVKPPQPSTVARLLPSSHSETLMVNVNLAMADCSPSQGRQRIKVTCVDPGAVAVNVQLDSPSPPTADDRYYSCGSSGTCCGCSDSKVSGDSLASSLVVADLGS
jgi:hypothetical protein